MVKTPNFKLRSAIIVAIVAFLSACAVNVTELTKTSLTATYNGDSYDIYHQIQELHFLDGSVERLSVYFVFVDGQRIRCAADSEGNKRPQDLCLRAIISKFQRLNDEDDDRDSGSGGGGYTPPF